MQLTLVRVACALLFPGNGRWLDVITVAFGQASDGK